MLFLFFSVFSFSQVKTEKDLFGRWQQKSERGELFIGFESDNTLQLYDKADSKQGNLKNKFTYKLVLLSGQYQITFRIMKNNIVVDSLLSEITFISAKNIVISPINGKQGLFKKKEEFIKVK